MCQCKLLGVLEGRQGKSSYCIPHLQAVAFVKGDDKKTFLHSKKEIFFNPVKKCEKQCTNQYYCPGSSPLPILVLLEELVAA